MTTNKPSSYPAWATDTNYPAGGAAWNGTANKIAPLSGEVQTGHQPSERPSPQKMNYTQNLVGRWLQWLAPADVENMQRLLDKVPNILGGGPVTRRAPDASLIPFVFVMSAGACAPIQGSANNKVKLSAGVLMQSPELGVLLSYALDGTDEVTIPVAAGAVPRVDLIQIKISPDSTTYDKRTVIDINLKAGTPGASPVVPDLDPGYVAYATVLVGASYAAAAAFKTEDTAGAVAVIHDQRLPLNARNCMMTGSDFYYDPAAWSAAGFNSIELNTAPSDPVGIVPSCGVDDGRILGVSLSQEIPVGSGTESNQLVKVAMTNISFNVSTLATIPVSIASGHYGTVYDILGDFDSNHLPAAGPTVVANSSAIGAPVWSNGHRCWVDSTSIAGGIIHRVGVRTINCRNGMDIAGAQLWVAG